MPDPAAAYVYVCDKVVVQFASGIIKTLKSTTFLKLTRIPSLMRHATPNSIIIFFLFILYS